MKALMGIKPAHNGKRMDFLLAVTTYRSVPLVLVALLRDYAYSAELHWLPNFKKKKKIFFFFFRFFFHLSKRLFTYKLLNCFSKTLLFTLGINNAC